LNIVLFNSDFIETKSKTHSSTNIQVENVDEADIIKTDGKYVYSLTADKIVITNVEDLAKPEVVSKVTLEDSTYIPEDLVLYNDYLIAIGTKTTSSYDSRNNSNSKISKSYRSKNYSMNSKNRYRNTKRDIF